jgi:hypothetical protein
LSKELEEPQSLTLEENADKIAALLAVQAQEIIIAWRIVLIQLASILVVSGVIYVVTSTPQYMIAALSGGVVSVFNGVLLAWRMSPARSRPTRNAQQQLWLMYFYAIERYLVVVVLLGLCFTVLKFAPLHILSGFVIGQFVMLAIRLFVGKSKINSE